MKLSQLGPNQTLITFGSGLEIFFSYETPVAGRLPGAPEYFKTARKYSASTQRHINAYIPQAWRDSIQVVQQEWIENLTGAKQGEHA